MRKTPNQIKWEELSREAEKRLNKLLAENDVDATKIKIPPKPQVFTQKQLKQIEEVTEKITKLETEARSIRTSKKAQDYNIKKGRYNNQKIRIKNANNTGNTKGNPKGNPQNLKHTGNPKGNPQNLKHTGNPQNLKHTGRPKGSKNKPKISTTPIKNIPINTDTVAMSDEIMYKQLWLRIDRGELYIKDFFKSLEATYGKYGMLDMIRKAESQDIILTDEIIYDSKGEKQMRYIEDFADIMDNDDYNNFKEYFNDITGESIEDFDTAIDYLKR